MGWAYVNNLHMRSRPNSKVWDMGSEDLLVNFAFGEICPPISFKMVGIIIQRVVASGPSSECVSPTMSSKFEANLKFNQFKYFAKPA